MLDGVVEMVVWPMFVISAQHFSQINYLRFNIIFIIITIIATKLLKQDTLYVWYTARVAKMPYYSLTITFARKNITSFQFYPENSKLWSNGVLLTAIFTEWIHDVGFFTSNFLSFSLILTVLFEMIPFVGWLWYSINVLGLVIKSFWGEKLFEAIWQNFVR